MSYPVQGVGISQGTLECRRSLREFERMVLRRFSPNVYVGYYRNGGISLINAATGQSVGDLNLEGHLESLQLERGGTRISINVLSANQVAVVDREKRQVITSWS